MNELTTALAARADARQRHQDAAAALERGRQLHQDAEAEAARLANEEQRWISRHAKKLETWIADGSQGAAPALTGDAKAQAALANARASAAAAAQALTRLAGGEAEERERLEIAHRRVCELKATVHRAHAQELIERMRGLLDEYTELRLEVGATACARELYGVKGDFTQVLTAEQLAYLNSPLPALPTIGDLFSTTVRPVVSMHTALSVSPSLIERYLAPWRERDAALEVGDDSLERRAA